MNDMEDKELQELFAAKRTVEANRRRQEELRRLIEATEETATTPARVRRLWPVWAGAAAAAVALLLLTLPALFGGDGAAPQQVAGTEVPEVVLPQAQPAETEMPRETGNSRESRNTRSSRESRISIESSSSEAAPQARPLEEEAPSPTPAPTFEDSPVLVVPSAIEEVIETAAPAPRVMRRQSSLIACTEGCTAPEGTNETPSNSNVKVNFFSNENYADATIHTFKINK